MNSICLVFDRLHCGYLGAYGNAWIETPEFDRLASQGFVFDQLLIDSPRLELLYRAYWEGRHAACPTDSAARGPSLIAQLNGQGVHTVLITDEVQVIGHELAREFRERIEIEPPPLAGLAETIEQTYLASCVAQIMERLEGLREPFFVWCHLAALGTHWDAPWEERTRYVEEEDPQGEPTPVPPCCRLPDEPDPDLFVNAYQAYAGQIGVWDLCLGGLLDFLEEQTLSARTLLALTSARGYPLGEHGRIGACDAALYGPLVHVPLVLRLPDGEGAAARSGSLVQTTDLWSTLAEWTGANSTRSATGRSLLPLVRGDVETLSDRLLVVGEAGQRGLRTPAWYLRQGEPAELFAKPSDRWETNDVADRCRGVVESLQAVLATHEQAIAAGDLSNIEPLEDVLVDGLG